MAACITFVLPSAALTSAEVIPRKRTLNAFSDYWEVVREYYFPFETELKAGTASVYDHEIPGGQYSNLRPQARGLGLEEKFEEIKKNYNTVVFFEPLIAKAKR